MLHRHLLVSASLLALWISPFSASAATVFTDDLTGFSNNISESTSGGNQGQLITSSVGTILGTVPAIDGDSIFVTIDTTAVDPDPMVSGFYGGGIQTTIDGAFSAGDLTSADPTDYDVVFDVAANGFAPSNIDIFLQFRNEFNDNQLGAQLSINQNNSVLTPFIAQLGASNGKVSVSIPLEEFSGTPADVSGLLTSDRIQFQFFTRSLDADYSDAANNVLVLDNVGVTAIPEPTSVAVLFVGGLCMSARRRRKA